jgi:hypothetical protein
LDFVLNEKTSGCPASNLKRNTGLLLEAESARADWAKKAAVETRTNIPLLKKFMPDFPKLAPPSK